MRVDRFAVRSLAFLALSSLNFGGQGTIADSRIVENATTVPSSYHVVAFVTRKWIAETIWKIDLTILTWRLIVDYLLLYN